MANKDIEKAITEVQLKKDRENLAQQMQKIIGAINYIDNKIAELAAPKPNRE